MISNKHTSTTSISPPPLNLTALGNVSLAMRDRLVTGQGYMTCTYVNLRHFDRCRFAGPTELQQQLQQPVALCSNQRNYDNCRDCVTKLMLRRHARVSTGIIIEASKVSCVHVTTGLKRHCSEQACVCVCVTL